MNDNFWEHSCIPGSQFILLRCMWNGNTDQVNSLLKLSWAKSFKMATLIFHSWLGSDLGQFQEKENEIRARREGWDGEMILHFQAELWTLLRDKKTKYIYLCWILIYRHATSVHNIIHFPETVLVMKCYLHPH